MLIVAHKDDFGRLDGVVWREAEREAEGFIGVQWVGVEHADVHEPFFEVVGRDEGYAGGCVVVDLRRLERIKVDSNV